MIFLIVALSFASQATAISLNCNFTVDVVGNYACIPIGLKIMDKYDRYISKVTGTHARGKNNNFVSYFYSTNDSVIHYLPIGLKSFFQNLNILVINTAGLREITAMDLSEFGEDLLELWLYGNNIQALDDDLFRYNPNLQFLDLSHNKIKFVEDGTFDAIPRLEFLGFDSNPCYSDLQILEPYVEGGLDKFFENIEANCKDSTYLIKKYNTQLQQEISSIRDDLNNLEGSIFYAYQELRSFGEEQARNLYQTFDWGRWDINNNIEKYCNAGNGNGRNSIASKLQQLQVLVAFRCFPGYNGDGVDSIDWK